MLGFILAVLWLTFQHIVSNAPLGDAFLSAATFLYYWHWVFGCIMLAVALFASLFLVIKGGTITRGSVLGMVVGGGAGAAMSLLIFFLVGVVLALNVGGAYLLMTSGAPGQAFEQFDSKRMLFGGVLLVLGMLCRSTTKSKD